MPTSDLERVSIGKEYDTFTEENFKELSRRIVVLEQIANGKMSSWNAPTLGTGALVSLTNTFTLVNSSTETVVISADLIPNYCKVGTVFRVWCHGIVSTTGTPILTLNVRMGPTTLIGTLLHSSAGTCLNNSSNTIYYYIGYFTVTAIGSTSSIRQQAWFPARSLDGGSTSQMDSSGSVATTVNTNVGNKLELNFKWGTASPSNTMSIYQATIELIKL